MPPEFCPRRDAAARHILEEEHRGSTGDEQADNLREEQAEPVLQPWLRALAAEGLAREPGCEQLVLRHVHTLDVPHVPRQWEPKIGLVAPARLALDLTREDAAPAQRIEPHREATHAGKELRHRRTPPHRAAAVRRPAGSDFQ